ncbi:hypothetical protein K491DRAFT_605901 [Lophiostoma macrostomum CBS 122681]|uniref:Uncharacterized protein n=1 Tax=Lophiostoma macrostomum CBS 122681 TaxID=1314788 RepID=A0A6A6SVZ6_9PLEO|nr:hypothetical protein K491DRAFT_605901 [Lophiostoma macrostomum CBS 122681]
MPPQQPSYGSQEYWNKHFTSNSSPFEWLEAPTALDPYIVDALENIDDQGQRILHIGSGTSLLSYHLRTFVKDPEGIHNLDYSDVAVELGKQRELEIFDVEEQLHGPDEAKSKYMRWSSVDLLSYSCLLETCKPYRYSVIVDKSTSDSIACADDVYVPLPYPISTNTPEESTLQKAKSPEPIHPLSILAIHLALVTKPQARWISLSYSQDRYPFLENPPPFAHGPPNPSKLWRLLSKHEIEVSEEPTSNGAVTTHRPKVLHWVYVLERTELKVYTR